MVSAMTTPNWLTVLTASAATLLGLGLGVPLAYLLARGRFPGRRIIAGIVELPVETGDPLQNTKHLLAAAQAHPTTQTQAQTSLTEWK